MMEIVETVDGTWMILVNGFQWGDGSQGQPDSSGAYPDTWSTKEEAHTAWARAHHTLPYTERDLE